VLARLRVSASGFHGPTRPHPVIANNSNTMSTPALNFVAVCGNANLLVNGTKVTYLKALKESGAAKGPSQTQPDIKERFAALTWVRHAVANAVDPATWPATLSAPLLSVLRSLYPIPPQRPDAPDGETDLHRLAHMVSLFLPAELSATSTTAPPTLPINPGGGINTTRPPAAQQASALAPAASSALPPPSPIVINLTGKKRWLMHDDLHILLPDAVYTALDSNSHLPAEIFRPFGSTGSLWTSNHHHVQWMASSLGAHTPPVYHPGHDDVTSPLHRGHGHGATLVTSLGPGRHGSRGNYLLLPRRDCLPTRLPQRDRPGRNASPQDLDPITVRLPWGTGHGKGPCLAQADLVSPKVVPVTPPVALTDNRSRARASGPGLTRPPADSTHGLYNPRLRLPSKPTFQMSWRRTQQANGSHGVREGLRDRPRTNNDKVLEANLLKGHGVSRTPWRPLSAS
jgi:hypothetical protein